MIRNLKKLSISRSHNMYQIKLLNDMKTLDYDFTDFFPLVIYKMMVHFPHNGWIKYGISFLSLPPNPHIIFNKYTLTHTNIHKSLTNGCGYIIKFFPFSNCRYFLKVPIVLSYPIIFFNKSTINTTVITLLS